jgi:hypothetical protein
MTVSMCAAVKEIEGAFGGVEVSCDKWEKVSSKEDSSSEYIAKAEVDWT